MRTIDQIAADIHVTDLPEYRRQLVYVDYRDRFNEDQVEEMLRGGWPDDTDEWISERAWESACALADELFKDECNDDEFDEHEAEWQFCDQRYRLIDALREADTSTPWSDLLHNTGPMLFRVSPDEDHMVWVGRDDTAESLHAALDLDLDLLPIVRTIWPEIEGYTVSGGAFGATIAFSAHPADVLRGANRPEATIKVSDPFLWLCNPWQGNGHGEVAEGINVTLKMSDVHTDRAAWGYSADDVFGGLCLDESNITANQEVTT